MTRVLIETSSAVVRAGLEGILQSAGMELADPDEQSGFEAGFWDGYVDVVLIDLEGEVSLPEETRSLLRTETGTPGTVILGSIEANEVLRAGAAAVLPRDATAAEIVAAVEAVATGLLVIHPARAGSLRAMAAERSAPDSRDRSDLTPREIEVLAMLAEGAGNKAIARALGISEHTVKFHVGSIMGKLDAGSRTEAVTHGVRQGLIMV